MNLAIIGATGNVGRKTIEILEKSKLKIDNLFLVASKKSAGSEIKFKGQALKVIDLQSYDFSNAEITFFAAGSKIASEYVPVASKQTIVIDNSKYFRMEKDVPLVVAEVNANALSRHQNIIANPNCSTIQLALVLKPLHDKYSIKRVVVSTYQAVSGAGKEAMDELISQTKESLDGKKLKSRNFTKPIAFNVIPHIDSFVEDGYTKEEWKMVAETKKILDKKIKLTATCVRVPVFVGHSEAVNIEFEDFLDEEEAREILRQSPGIIVVDKREEGGYTTPIECAGDYATFISRIRQDSTTENGLNLWCVSDNLRKGAALNAVQIAELLGNKVLKKE